jgi:hypothetical protein
MVEHRALRIDHPRMLGGVCDLQNNATTLGFDEEVLIALARQRACAARDPKMVAGKTFGVTESETGALVEHRRERVGAREACRSILRCAVGLR